MKKATDTIEFMEEYKGTLENFWEWLNDEL